MEISPENIMLKNKNDISSIQIVDFGISKVLADELADDAI